MARPRDSQKSRLYASEWEVFGRPYMEFEDLQQLKDYLWTVLENRHVRNKYPIAEDIASGILGLKVSAGQGHRRAKTKREIGFFQVSFPVKARCRWMVLHELAHVFTPREYAGHGREFCRTYLHLIRLFFGEETQNKLKAAMKKHKCKYSKSHTRWKTPPTQEEKDAMLARLMVGRNK